MSTFIEMPVKVSLVGKSGREWNGRCEGFRSTCSHSGERAGQKAVAAAINASGKVNHRVDPHKIVITRNAAGKLVGRYDLDPIPATGGAILAGAGLRMERGGA